MPGLISTAPQPPAPIVAQNSAAQNVSPNDTVINDPNLNKLVTEIEAKVPPNMEGPYRAIVVSGMQIMFGQQTTNMMQTRLQSAIQNQNQGGALGDVIARLILMIQHESNGRVQLPAAIPAAIVLLCHMLDYAEKSNQIKVTASLIATAVQVAVANTLKYFGVGPQQIMRAKAQIGQGGA